MIRLLHVLDAAAGEPEFRAIRLLLDRLPPESFAHEVAATDSRPAIAATSFLRRLIHRADQRIWIGSSAGPALRSLVRSRRIDMIHTWGPDALAASKAASEGQPLVVSGIRIEDADKAAAWLRQIRPTPAVVAASQVARAQLAGFGVRADHIAVVRDAVDFGEINAARNADARRRIAGDAAPVILTPTTAERDGGQFETLWACAMLQQIFPAIRVVVPGASPETDRLRRMAQSLELPDMLLTTGSRFNMAELAAAADVFVVAPKSEADCHAVGWAMAAGAAIVGVARRSVAELIADRSNGLLCINNQPRRLAAALLRVLEDAPLKTKLTDTARGQAFEVFSSRGLLDNMGALYSNVANRRPVTDGVHDAAMVA